MQDSIEGPTHTEGSVQIGATCTGVWAVHLCASWGAGGSD